MRYWSARLGTGYMEYKKQVIPYQKTECIGLQKKASVRFD